MQTRILRVQTASGLHLRVAAEITRAAKAFEAEITLAYGGVIADAKSVISVLLLGAAQDADVVVQACGVDERAAIEAMETLLRYTAGSN